MRKPLIVFVFIVLTTLNQFIVCVPIPKKSFRIQIYPDYLHALAAYKRLEPKTTRDELRAIATIGILNGAQKTEEQMTEKLIEVLRDLLENTDANDQRTVLSKIQKIEKQVTRDQHALEILSNAMDLAAGKMSPKEFRKEMLQMLEEVHRQSADTTLQVPSALVDQETGATAHAHDVGERIRALRQNVMSQMDVMKEMVNEKIEKTLKHIVDVADKNGLIAEASEKIARGKRNVRGSKTGDETEVPAEVKIIDSILSEADFRKNLIIDMDPEKRADSKDSFELDDLNKKNIANRSDNKVSSMKRTRNNNNNIEDIVKAVVRNITLTTNATQKITAMRPLKQLIDPAVEVIIDEAEKQEVGSPEEDAFPEDGGGGGGGGLVGIITGLSGGEGGSDIGALIGALTGLISTIFGPGGLDVDSLIGTATSLISGLLAGNKNFGTVLGMYVGTALDGLSGGGGAINNGQFIGNLLGTVVASLSADPEEDDAPIKPLVFVENFLSSFMEAKNRVASGEEASGERKEHGMKDGGSDSGGFVKSIVSHIVSNAISFVLNASLGAVGGASKASSSLVASSSHKSH